MGEYRIPVSISVPATLYLEADTPQDAQRAAARFAQGLDVLGARVDDPELSQWTDLIVQGKPTEENE